MSICKMKKDTLIQHFFTYWHQYTTDFTLIQTISIHCYELCKIWSFECCKSKDGVEVASLAIVWISWVFGFIFLQIKEGWVVHTKSDFIPSIPKVPNPPNWLPFTIGVPTVVYQILSELEEKYCIDFVFHGNNIINCVWR